jgi:hypothetical protein
MWCLPFVRIGISPDYNSLRTNALSTELQIKPRQTPLVLQMVSTHKDGFWPN